MVDLSVQIGEVKLSNPVMPASGTFSYDFAEISQTSNPSNWGEISSPNSVPVVEGTPKSVLDEVVIFHFNDIERTINTLDKFADEVLKQLS